jgi:hypothetical protein
MDYLDRPKKRTQPGFEPGATRMLGIQSEYRTTRLFLVSQWKSIWWNLVLLTHWVVRLMFGLQIYRLDTLRYALYCRRKPLGNGIS